MFVVLAGGAWYDIREHRIPNWWILSGGVCGFLLCVLGASDGGGSLGVWKTAVMYILRLSVTIVVLFPLFLIRVMGAGDIKMMALMVGNLGFLNGAAAIGYGFAAGAILGLVKVLLQRNLQRRLMILTAYIRRLFLTKEIVPYYQAERDRREGVIPFAVCLLLGFLWLGGKKII